MENEPVGWPAVASRSAHRQEGVSGSPCDVRTGRTHDCCGETRLHFIGGVSQVLAASSGAVAAAASDLFDVTTDLTAAKPSRTLHVLRMSDRD